MASWRARKAVLASRGEVDGPRVAECSEALSFWRTRTFLIREMKISEQRADELMDQLLRGDREREAAEAVSR